MSLSAGALQLAGFLMAHGFWTIADAAPAEVPHAAVEPGRLPNRTSSHPTNVLAARVPRTAAVITGQL